MPPGDGAVARLRALEDAQEIRQLFIDYKTALNGKNFAAYADLFARDGEFIAGEIRARGRAGIQKLVEDMLGSLLGAEPGQDFHVVANPQIQLESEDRARAQVMWLYVVRGDQDEPAAAKIGHYDDVLVREDGRWRFLSRSAPTDIPAV
jgi:uncharacterized protein (TIGR02246 family)